VPIQFPQETAAERRRRKARERYWDKRREILEQRRIEAQNRATQLLMEHIGAEAFDELHKVGFIELDSQKYKGCRYRLPRNHNAYIEIVDSEGKVIDTLCIQPKIECPTGDRLLTRWLLIKHDEERLLAVANHWGPREKSYYAEPVN
jgi:hypothetical protein